MNDIRFWQFHYLISISSIFIALVLITHLLRQRRSTGSTLAWLLLIFFVPYIGAFFYLLLGVRKIRRAEKIKLYSPIDAGHRPHAVSPVEKILLASGIFPKVGGNEMLILGSGEEAYQRLMENLNQARKSIHITSFILGLDPVGTSILDLLVLKARQGVQVRLLLDGFGSFWLFPWRLRRYRRSGVKIAFFLPLIRHLPLQGFLNLRNHRKLVVVDEDVAIVGGMNLADEYLGPTPSEDRWLDLSVQVKGPVVAHFSDLFRADWEFASGEKLRLCPESADPSKMGELMQVVPSGPDLAGDPLYDSIAAALFEAQKRIWIATPYFVPDEILAKALEIAAKRGVQVHILLPKKSNHFLADLARVSYLRQISHAGAQIYFYPHRMMHAKAVLIDEMYAIVGSANFDMRSLLLNCEMGVCIYSREGIRQLSEWYQSVVTQTVQEPLEGGLWVELIEGAARLLAPIL